MNTNEKYQKLVFDLRNASNTTEKIVILQNIYALTDTFSEEEKEQIFSEINRTNTLNAADNDLQKKIIAAGLPSFETFFAQQPVLA
jgi:hypothetical protein